MVPGTIKDAPSDGWLVFLMIDEERLHSVLLNWAGREEGFVEHHLCATVADILSTAGTSVSIRTGDSITTLCASDPVAARVEELHLALGEGPGIDVVRSGRRVVEPDLGALREAHWVAFAEGARRFGITGVATLPLRVESIRIGALSVYFDTAPSLTDEWIETAELVGFLTTHAVLSLLATTPWGMLPDEFEQLARYRASVDQASGMISAQLGITIAEALAVLRARAFSDNQTLPNTAEAVTTGAIRFH
jgi:ANTAR domain